MNVVVFFFQAEDGIRDLVRSRGLGDVYKRQQSKSLKSKTCCDDIYFVDKRKLVIDLTTIVLDEKKKPIKAATAQLIEVMAGKEGSIQSKTNSEGNEISHLLDKDRSYKIVVSKEGYFPADFQVNTVGITSDQSMKKEVILRVMPPESDVEIITINEPIRLNNIYYDFDDDFRDDKVGSRILFVYGHDCLLA